MDVRAGLLGSAARFGLIFAQPFRTLRRRIDNWIATRTPRVPGPWVVNRRRVYILPTRYGYVFGILLVVMLLGAMNYSNSMAFALTFLLAGLGLVSMHYTHGNLVNISIRPTRVAPVFAGDTARFDIELENPSRTARFALTASWQDKEAQNAVDVPQDDKGLLPLKAAADRRGLLAAPRFAVSTEFPLGLFHAWTWVELDMSCLVYPRAAAAGTAPPAATGGRGSRTGTRRGQEEFAGLRNYQRGDAPRSIHWKTLARHRMPMVKQFAETLDDELWLDWSVLPPAWDVERRLSQLTRWVLDAEGGDRPYGLRLPGLTRAPSLGEIHRHECLKALALFQATA